MRFNKVEISRFRNLLSTSFHPSPSLNLITGANGSGKSSLLEALYYLATGSSFRTHRLSHIIHQQHDCFILFAECSNAHHSHRVGLKRCKDLIHHTRLDGHEITKRSELVQLLPLQVLSPESINLLVEGSDHRRSFIDWALFHVEHSFHYHLSHYQRALKQRNALLKSDNLNSLHQWDAQLVEHGEVIDTFRTRYLDSIKVDVDQILAQLLPDITLEMQYRSGWSKELNLVEALSQSRENDRKLRYTTVGPHRGDFVVKSDGVKVADLLSRGQLKLIVIALKLAQISTLQTVSGKLPIILVDDLAAELDVTHRATLLLQLKALSTQIFVTTPDIELIDHSQWAERKVFHVEHGDLQEVV